MSTQIYQPRPGSPQETIRLLQQELTETNREVLLLTVELDKRVEARTAELCATQEELKMKNSELLRQTARLEAANNELEAFSYSVSHDLRAPLRHIQGYVDALQEEYAAVLGGAGRLYLEKVLDSITRMAKLINDLLAFSRMARAEMQQTRFSMGELVGETLQEMREDLQGRNIEWEIQPLPAIKGDQALLKQVWINLLSNAVKYTRPRDPAKIQIRCAEKAGEWEFCVRDNGVGFDMRYAGKLFGVFQRLHRADEFEGTGIGLVNVRQIIKRHGGRTWAESKVDEGTAIYFTLPILQSEGPEEPVD
jgi:light-regulated signal transduction histidine kinase (bacteriophytochrome)